MAGSCAIENRDLAFEIAEKIKGITDQFGIPYIFKGSYRKANRTKLDSFTGIGDITALEILRDLKKITEHLIVAVPFIEDAVPAIHKLAADGVRVAATLIYSAAQGILAGRPRRTSGRPNRVRGSSVTRRTRQASANSRRTTPREWRA